MIPFIRPYYDEEDFQAIKDVLQSGWVAQGPKVEELEDAVAKYLSCKHVISTTNCTTALILALKALQIGPDDEVIVPDFTFPATALAVTNVGATPILVEVHSDTYNIKLRDISAAITNKTKAIIAVHLFGLACNIGPIKALAQNNGLLLIEDAACSLGAIDFTAEIGNRTVGTTGHIGCFSLHASKGISTGEGGLICTNDDILAERMRRLSCFGDERAYRRSKNDVPFFFDPRAGNYKMSDITAALALSQLKKINKMIEWRIKIAQEWDEIIANDEFLSSRIISRPKIATDHSHIYQSYVAVCEEGHRNAVMMYMQRNGFQCGIGTHAIHRYPNIFGHGYSLKTSDYLFDNAISFPRYYGLSPKVEWAKRKGDTE